MLSAITLSGVSLDLPNGRTLFHNISFSLSAKLTALVGPNGVGKTSLAKLIAGELTQTTGTVRKNRAVTFFEQRETPPEISVEDYLATRYSWSLIGEDLLAGLNRQTLCSHLSGGEWMRVRLATTLDDQYLILDEPTNDLDREAKSVLQQFLSKYPYGVLLISHDREFLALCEDVLELSNQGLAKFGGGWSAYEDERNRERSQSAEHLDKAKRERKKAQAERATQLERQEKRNRQGNAANKKGGMPKILLGARKRNAQATTGKLDSFTMERAHSKVREAYEAMSEIKVDPLMYADLVGDALPAQKLIAEAKGFNILFEHPLYTQDLNFAWRGNIRIAIKGSNGSGKSTLIKALMGTPFKTKGELRVGEIKRLYIDQRCSSLNDSQSIFENARSHSHLSESELRNGLAKFLFTGDSVFQTVHTLSGGERLRTALACGLLGSTKPELIIFDEPTNNLDLGNIEFLESLIAHFKGAVVLISHDETFLSGCGIEQELLL